MSRQITVFFAIAALATSSSIFAASSPASLAVSVHVIARTILTVDSQPASIDITAADVARGYVDLPNAVAFHVRSNAANGYEIEFQPLSSPFGSAEVSWGRGVASVGPDGAWLVEPYHSGTTRGSFAVRLSIAPGTQPARYPWPVRFDAGSL